MEGSAAEVDFFAQDDVSAAAAATTTTTSNAKGGQAGAESDSMDLTGSALIAIQTSAEISAICNEVRAHCESICVCCHRRRINRRACLFACLLFRSPTSELQCRSMTSMLTPRKTPAEPAGSSPRSKSSRSGIRAALFAFD